MTSDELKNRVVKSGAISDQLDASFEEYIQKLGIIGLYDATVYASALIAKLEAEMKTDHSLAPMLNLIFIAENYARQRAQAMAEQYVREKCK